MLQDIRYGRLENEYRRIEPKEEDVVICVRQGSILLRRDAQERIVLPRYRDICQWSVAWESWNETRVRYVFRMEDENYFLWMGEAGEAGEDWYYQNARQLRAMQSKDICYAAMTAWHLYNWYRNSRYCGRCGGLTVHDERERMVRCPRCGNLVYPRINPAVIVAVTDGDRILLSKYARPGYVNYALIAGFTEIGETLEQTVQREVMEEVGLKIKNIRYYKSQPWGIDGNILSGFFCDLDGDDTIHLDETELSLAEWHYRDRLPVHDDGFSLTREMIGAFEAGREPG